MVINGKGHLISIIKLITVAHLKINRMLKKYEVIPNLQKIIYLD